MAKINTNLLQKYNWMHHITRKKNKKKTHKTIKLAYLVMSESSQTFPKVKNKNTKHNFFKNNVINHPLVHQNHHTISSVISSRSSKRSRSFSRMHLSPAVLNRFPFGHGGKITTVCLITQNASHFRDWGQKHHIMFEIKYEWKFKLFIRL